MYRIDKTIKYLKEMKKNYRIIQKYLNYVFIKIISFFLEKLNYKIYATKGTSNFLNKFCIESNLVNKVNEGEPHIVELIEKNKINLIINTTSGSKSIADSLSIRRTALRKKVPYFTTISAAKIAPRPFSSKPQNDSLPKLL